MKTEFNVDTKGMQACAQEYKTYAAGIKDYEALLEGYKNELKQAGSSYDSIIDGLKALEDKLKYIYEGVDSMSDSLDEIVDEYTNSEKKATDIGSALLAAIGAALGAAMAEVLNKLRNKNNSDSESDSQKKEDDNSTGKNDSNNSKSDSSENKNNNSSSNNNNSDKNNNNKNNGDGTKNGKGEEISGGATSSGDGSGSGSGSGSSSNTGNGSSKASGFSDNGLSLLCDLEVGNKVKRDSSGRITAIKIEDIGDGGYTVGFGVYIKHGDQATIDYYKKTYGIDVTDTSAYVPIDVCQKIFDNEIGKYTGYVDSAVKRYGLDLTQSQYDALTIMAYNRPSILNDGHAVGDLLKAGNMNPEDWRNAMINEYQGLKNWNKYGNGWTNRIDDELECFFQGDYKRNH